MALKNNDLLLVNRGGDSFKIKYSEVKGEFVEVAGDDMTGDLTLGTDKITLGATTGRGEFSGGVKVTGGGAGAVQNGIGFAAAADGSDPKLRLIADGATRLQLSETLNTSSSPLSIKPEAKTGLALTFGSPDTSESLTGDSAYMDLNADQTGATFDGKFSFVKVSSPSSQVDAAVSCPDMAGIRINNSFGKFNVANDGNTVSGLKLEMAARTGKNIFNILADGMAPNFLKGSTYIGGDTARNTFDLWKSTLTEEQLEELTAGTLVAPANVALPGDGSFARQWWYDQQDAETQAELDAGTLDYPTHLAAATFTDTFGLGNNTAINLLNNGDASFSGTVTAKTGIYTNTITALGSSAGLTFQTNNSSGNYTFKTTDSSWQANLRFNNLTVSRNFNFPDAGGTIALTSDLEPFADIGSPTGSVMMFAGATAPSGWLECNGQSTSAYAALKAIVGNKVPDLRGQFVRGWDNGRGVDVDRDLLSNQGEAYKSHNHGLTPVGDHTHSYDRSSDGTGTPGGSTGVHDYNASRSTGGAGGHNHTVESSGGSETRPRNTALMYIIKT